MGGLRRLAGIPAIHRLVFSHSLAWRDQLNLLMAIGVGIVTYVGIGIPIGLVAGFILQSVSADRLTSIFVASIVTLFSLVLAFLVARRLYQRHSVKKAGAGRLI